MQTSQLLRRSLTHYWRTNLAVVLGVATAVAVLAGALLVGDSVRASLRDLFMQRLGQTDLVITSAGFFREQLAADIRNDPQFAEGGFVDACSLIALEGTVTHERSKRVGSGIKVYGVDERFWQFHRQATKQAPQNREIFVSEALARELASDVGDSLVLRVEKPSEIPVESLHSRKEELGSTLRLIAREILASEALGEFSIQTQQSAVRAVFVPLRLLQQEIGKLDKVNLILLEETSHDTATQDTQSTKTALLKRILRERTSLEDFGIKLRTIGEPLSISPAIAGGSSPRQPNGDTSHPVAQLVGPKMPPSISFEHDSRLLSDSLSSTALEVAKRLSMHAIPVLSYLANSISDSDVDSGHTGNRSMPYSLVTAIDNETFFQLAGKDAPLRLAAGSSESSPPSVDPKKLFVIGPDGSRPIILNAWAARDLGVQPGDTINLKYYLWREHGGLETGSTLFTLVSVVPIEGFAADKDLVPEYPGITGSETVAEWDPPFPVDLKLVRPQDEAYWKQYRTTPKAFIPLSVGQELWQSRFGKLTSLRLTPPSGMPLQQALENYRRELKSVLDPELMGLTSVAVRQQGLAASRGSTDFGEYFLYFSFFLVVSALLLTALFFKLGVEQRLREIGVLQAIGFPASKIRTLFVLEGLILALIGSVIGLVGAVAYGQFVMMGLRTWWVDAVGTSMLRLHISPLSLVLGATGGIFAAVICISSTLRGLAKESTRSLLAGTFAGEGGARRTGNGDNRRLFTSLHVAILLNVIGIALLITAGAHLVGQVAGFFGGGLVLLMAFLAYQSVWLRRNGRKPLSGNGWWSVARLGFRNATYRPGRSVLCIALIAAAVFIIVAVDSFRQHEGTLMLDRNSGSGGFLLLAESLLPLVHDPNTSEGREALNLGSDNATSPLVGVTFARFRVRPGDDASCLNLYQPRNPKIIAAAPDFVRSNRFAFQNTLASTVEEKENPWLLLNREFPDGAVPVIADANSITYVLHLKLGEDLILNQSDRPIRLRLVGALADSIFQSELLMTEQNFLRLFPEQEGYRFFLVDTPQPDQSTAIAAALEDRLSDFGFDVQSTSERLANFHRVENTYLSTFQMLGGLGLILGTLGMAAVLLRNVMERRRELALLRAVGYNSSHFTEMVIAENVLLLFSGLVTGTVCALLAIAPVFFARHTHLPNVSLGYLLLAVLVSGLTASVVATWAALRSSLLPALRSE